MKTFRKFMTDQAALCGCVKCVAKRKKQITDAKPTTAQATAEEKPRVDLNEMHRRFWAKLAGKE